MKKRIFALMAALWLMIPQCGVAGYVAHNGLYNSKNFLEIPGEGVGFYIFPLDTFTFVTPETLDEHMDLCLYRGGTREGVRLRMNTGHVLWEGYSDSLCSTMIGSVVGTHAGPGAIAVAFFAHKK